MSPVDGCCGGWLLLLGVVVAFTDFLAEDFGAPMDLRRLLGVGAVTGGGGISRSASESPVGPEVVVESASFASFLDDFGFLAVLLGPSAAARTGVAAGRDDKLLRVLFLVVDLGAGVVVVVEEPSANKPQSSIEVNSEPKGLETALAEKNEVDDDSSAFCGVSTPKLSLISFELPKLFLLLEGAL
jgi:hypothetical protein